LFLREEERIVVTQEQNIDRKDLKIQALLEKLSAQDSQIADLRVEVTVLEHQVREVTQAPKQQETPVMSFQPGQPEVVQGEVIQPPAAE
jgi:hypothetical protein